MRTRLIWLLLALLTLTSTGQAQAPKSVQRFEGKTGGVVIRGFTHFDLWECEPGAIQITPTTYLDVSSKEMLYGIGVFIRGGGPAPRNDDSVFVDESEIDGLLKGIDYIAKIDSKITKLKSFEATYSTPSHLDVTVYNDKETLMVRVSCGEPVPARAYFSLSRLPAFTKLITDARDQLLAAR